MHRISAALFCRPPPKMRFRQRSDRSRTIQAAHGLKRCVPACFIANFSTTTTLIGQWSAQTILSRPQDGPFCLQLHSSAKFDAVTCCACWCETCLPALHVVPGPPESTTQKGTFMKYAIALKVAAVAVVAGLAGCQDMKPLQADVADLKSQVAKLQSDVAAAKSSADQANSTAQSASQAASGAQSTANQALAARSRCMSVARLVARLNAVCPGDCVGRAQQTCK